ncbi:cyanate transporter [Leeia oryzae]|uniref:cyanate transporter n=1 Tax=Leeia oryzae TaxID=356662 RepID=UPI0012E99331|nr:cyanate transporter [Leeia oryzae]
MSQGIRVARHTDKTCCTARAGEPAGYGWLLVVLLGLNLRPFMTSVGPLLDELRTALSLGFRPAALLTTLPFVLMGVMAFAGSALSRRLGEHRVMTGALGLLLLGCLSRGWVQDNAGLFAGTVVASVGVATLQALMPGVIKRGFGGQAVLMMGVYSAALVGGGALGALVSPWFAAWGGWRTGLAVWSGPALLALLLWCRQGKRPTEVSGSQVAAVPMRFFFSNIRAWLLALYFGLTNSGYSSLVAWLPTFYREHGMGRQAAGNLLALMALCQAGAALVFPALSRQQADRRQMLWLVMGLQAAGFAGLAVAPSATPWLWIALAGLGLGGFFSLSIIVTLEHFSEVQPAGVLAAFVQGVGFLLSSCSPWLLGWLRDETGGFTAGWSVHVGLIVLMGMLTRVFSAGSYLHSMHGWQARVRAG